MAKDRVLELKRKLLIELIKKMGDNKCYTCAGELHFVRGKAYSMYIEIKNLNR